MTFYRIDNQNKIIDFAKFKYSDECLETEQNILLNFNGVAVFESETLTQEYQTAKQAYEIKQANAKRITELKSKLASYDYIGNKIATGRATIADYATEIAQMTAWANEINELEAQNAD